jgi:hypothetical protein
MILDLIDAFLESVFYGVAYMLLRLGGVRKPSDRAFILVSTLFLVGTLIGLVYVFSRP